jgi:PII-like signaling protein
MSTIMSLRIYFHGSEKALPTRRLHRFFKPSLASYLLRHASHDGIEQVVMHHVQAGYLKGKRMAHYHVETAHAHLPQCIEMIDREHKLRGFLQHHAAHLLGVRAVFLPCELALDH